MSSLPYSNSPSGLPQQSNSSERSCLGWSLGCGAVAGFALLLVCGGGLMAVFVGLFSILKSSEPYVRSLATVRQDPQVQQILGEPVNDGWFPTGSINLNKEDGSAELTYSISGPNGAATVELVAQRENGDWVFRNLTVIPRQGPEPINLTEAANDVDAIP